MTKSRTSPETLDAAYNEWRTHNVQNTPHYSNWRRSYQKTYRLDSINQRFEHWVNSQGGEIRQENKRRFIEFENDERRLQFVLSWT
jgi:hypothetical protein